MSIIRRVLGIEIARERRPRWQSVAAYYLVGIAALALATFICFRLDFGVSRTGFIFVILIALISPLGGYSGSVVLSILGAACLNYFFTAPLFEFRIDAADDIARVLAFLTTSLVVTALTSGRKRAEEQVSKSNARLEEAQRIAHVGWWERDLRSDRLIVSDEVYRILGLRPDERWLELVHDDDRVRVAEAAAAALRPGAPRLDIEYRVVRPDGTERILHTQGDVIWDASGRPLRQFGVLQDITELRRTEDALRDSSERFRALVQFSFDVYWESDSQHRFTRQEFAKGLADAPPAGSEIGKTRWEVPYLEPEAEAWRRHRETLDAHLPFRDFELARPTPEGGKRYVSVSGLPVFDRSGHFVGYRGVGRHITERKRAEEELSKSKARLEEAQRIAHVGWWERDYATNHVHLSDEVCRIFGIQPVDLPHWHGRWLDLIHPEDRARAADASAAALSGGPRYNVEYRVVRLDGAVRIVHSQGDVIWEKSGKPLRQFGVLQDITELRQAEDELRASEARFRTFVENATDAFFVLDEHSTVVDVNRQACESLGYNREELIGKHRRDFDAGLDEASIQRLKQRIAAEDPVTFETRHRRKDGASFPVEVRVSRFYQGGPRFLCLVRDITERKQAEEALRRSEAYLAEAQRLSHTGTLAFNATSAAYWSEESYRIWGFDPLQGLPDRETVFQRIHPDDRERVNLEVDEALREKRNFTLEFRIVPPDGSVKDIEATGHPLLSPDGEFTEMVATHIDVTERKRAQEQSEKLRELEAELAHMNRLSIMGELTASLAHEILHPIATARNNARAGMRFLEMNPPNLGEVREALGLIVRDADRAKDIVGRIRDHIKKAPPRRDLFDLNEAVTEVIEMVEGAIAKSRVSVRTDLMEGLTRIRGDRVQLQQVVVNLVLNAIEAMSSVEDGARELSIVSEQGKNGSIRVAVHDSGPGIDAGHRELVFEPFYTTKTSGVGMGLSICRSIIDAHGGRLWAEANAPRGAVFQFTLPSAEEDS